MTGGMVSVDSELGKALGFTSERFTPNSYLWLSGDRLMISLIVAQQKGRGDFSRLLTAIEARGLKVAVPTPLATMRLRNGMMGPSATIRRHLGMTLPSAMIRPRAGMICPGMDHTEKRLTNTSAEQSRATGTATRDAVRWGLDAVDAPAASREAGTETDEASPEPVTSAPTWRCNSGHET